MKNVVSKAQDSAAACSADARDNTSTETPHQKRKRLKEEERVRAREQEDEVERERLAGVPARLFDLQVQLARLENSPFHVESYVAARDPENQSNEKPGLFVKIGSACEMYLTLEAKDWEFQFVRDGIVKEQTRISEEDRDRALAMDVKSRLSVDEIKAFKKYG